MCIGRRYAVIVAGGKGLRMGGDIPKQFVSIGGKPVLLHTLIRFSPLCDTLILVLPSEHISYWENLCQNYPDIPQHHIVAGGATRFHSVRSGLEYLAAQKLTAEDLVAIHDGVRPFVDASVITECFQQASRCGIALPYRPVIDSLRRYVQVGQEKSQAVHREEYIAVQTPQTFLALQLYQAYQVDYICSFTDDASVWEYSDLGHPHLVLSNEENIKLTSPMDLHLAELLLHREHS